MQLADHLGDGLTDYTYTVLKAQAEEFMKRAMPHLKPDVYPEYDLHNIYYDTPENALIIHCLSHPMYKEKLRLRTYGEYSVLAISLLPVSASPVSKESGLLVRYKRSR